METNFIFFIIIGFLAQMIDGVLGMAYGVISTTCLLTMGITPVIASASVHTAEIFTTGVSGLAHLKFGNVDRGLFKRLLISGVIGGILGAYVLTMLPVKPIKIFVAFYLTTMGVVIIYKAVKKIIQQGVINYISPLGLIGGFFDAIGGGGWGPIVTSTLVAGGCKPRFSIATVNLAEFFVTIAEVITFFIFVRFLKYQIIFGLIIGGILAAPLAAYVCAKLPARLVMVWIGIFIIVLNLWVIIQTLL